MKTCGLTIAKLLIFFFTLLLSLPALGANSSLVRLKYDPAYKTAGIGSLYETSINTDATRGNGSMGRNINVTNGYQPISPHLGASGGPGGTPVKSDPTPAVGRLFAGKASHGVSTKGDDPEPPTFSDVRNDSEPLPLEIPDIQSDSQASPLTEIGPSPPTLISSVADVESQQLIIEQAVVVPEPSTLLLMSSGLAGIVWFKRRRDRH